ncbi:CdvA-like protein [Candidatus Bathyarchaeota archaeon]|nr:CdvA-like protein [Candidatus Bathyarchaeota archaeon]
MSISVNAPGLVGKSVKDENEKEIGKVVSFLIDSSGQPQEALVETVQGQLARYPFDLLDMVKDEIIVVSDVAKKIESLTEQLPKIRKKRNILDKLAANKVISSGIYDNLCKEFDKALKEMRNEAQTLIEAVDKQVKAQDEQLKTLQLARAFLEIEHGIGTINEETYQQSIITILREVKNTQQTKLSLLRAKDKIADALLEEKEEPKPEPAEEKKVEAAEASPEVKNEIATQSKESKQTLTVRVTEG